MIRADKLNKYYNRNKKNELHVLNDVSIDFEPKGLVVLLGASGSGKTTLLNVLGGMDKFAHGAVAFEEAIIKRYSSKVFDDLRNEKIGMIFQNYYLLPNLSVHENIALTLHMIGIHDKDEIDRRIQYLLDAVNMFNYRHRKANQLSGGQQQRVAIARALAKNPALILADEPTGNLDSKNTLEIMRIIKQISKEKLVIMVTHEKKLANFFADRIIEIEDGKIIDDRKNDSNGTLDVSLETDIYLKDLPTHKIVGENKLHIDYYADTENEPVLNARLIVKNKTLYLDLQGHDLKKIIVLDDNSEINIIDQASDEQPLSKETERGFNYGAIFEKTDTVQIKRRRVINPKLIVKQTLTRLLESTRGQKMLYIGFAIGAMVVAYAISSVFNILTVRDEEFLNMPRNTIVIRDEDITFPTLQGLMNHSSIDGYGLLSSSALNVNIPRVYTRYSNITETALHVSFASIEMVRTRDLTMGRLPETPFEVVADQAWIRKHVFKSHELSALDFTTYESAMYLSFKLEIGSREIPITIVGISDTDTPVIYMDELLRLQFTEPGFHPKELFDNQLVITEGRNVQAANEILVPSNSSLPVGGTRTYSQISFNIVGKYELDTAEGTLVPTIPLLTKANIERVYYARTTSNQRERYLYSNNVKETINFLAEEGINGVHIYASQRSEYFERAIMSSVPSLIFSGFSILASALSFYFIIRSSMISRIYEIGVYRSLGTKRRDIIKRFIIEIAVITSFSSLIGFIFMNYIIHSAQRATGDIIRIGHVSVLSILTGIILIYTINILSGILPVGVLLRKTPAQINTQYDL